MKRSKIKSWDEYWTQYESLCSELKVEGKIGLVKELIDAQQYVNGLTDGWFGFLEAFEKAIVDTEQLSKPQKNQVENVISVLKETLNNDKYINGQKLVNTTTFKKKFWPSL